MSAPNFSLQGFFEACLGWTKIFGRIQEKGPEIAACALTAYKLLVYVVEGREV